MKTNNQKDNRTIHQRVEHFFRSRACLAVILTFMAVAILKADSRVMGMMRQVYAQGFGLIGMYMREETTRMPVNFGISIRSTTISGR